MSFNNKLIDLLKTDSRFIDDEGELLLAAVQDRAWKMDRDLVKLLLSDKEIKAKYFIEIEKHWIFNFNTFIDYVSQKDFLHSSYTRFRNRIGLTIGGEYMRERKNVALAWPYKDTVLEGGQTKEEEQGREEIFFNEVLAQDEITRLFDPKVLTNFMRYTPTGKKKVASFKRGEDGVIRENMIFKGNNLVTLHSIKEQFRGQVRLIYIDPPFNTERDSFSYNDNFKHSAWLTFMENRLSVAYDFLTGDGNIVVHVDNNESHYVKVLLDEIFGRNNFVNEIIWHKGREGGSSRSHSTSSSMPTEYQNLLLYAKDKVHRYWKPPLGPYKASTIKEIDKDSKGWFYTRGRMGRMPADWELEAGKGLKTYVSDRTDLNKDDVIKLLTAAGAKYVALGDVWSSDLVKNSKEADYDTAKPEGLLKIIIEAGSKADDLILDFFLGSGTTASVCLKMGRRYIGIEQLDGGMKAALPRLSDVISGKDAKGISKSMGWKGGGDFIYCELMKYNEVFLEQIRDAKSNRDLVRIWEEMSRSSFLNWYVNPAIPEQAIKDFEELGKGDKGIKKQKRLLAELLDKNQLYVNLSEIDDSEFSVRKEDKKLNKAFYGESYNA